MRGVFQLDASGKYIVQRMINMYIVQYAAPEVEFMNIQVR